MPPETHQIAEHLRAIRIWAAVFVVGLVVSGVTAFPLQTETALLVRGSVALHGPMHWQALHEWLVHVSSALAETNRRFPFLAYGTDWLAFGHLVIAVAFLGLFKDPVRNKWLLTFGLIACAGVIPLALIAGEVRGIPVYWRLVDSSFGFFGCVPLLFCIHRVHKIEKLSTN